VAPTSGVKSPRPLGLIGRGEVGVVALVNGAKRFAHHVNVQIKHISLKYLLISLNYLLNRCAQRAPLLIADEWIFACMIIK
jgi:hypothetical protein